MNYGLYLSARGAQAQSTRLDVVANNLANAGTSGFKRDLAIFQEALTYDREHGISNEVPGNLNDSTGGIELADIATDFANGPLDPTGGTYDFGLAGPGFFQVQNGAQTLLTRNGHFTVNTNGELVTEGTGMPLMTREGGTIVIPDDARSIQVSSDGTVNAISQDNFSTTIGTIGVVQPQSYDLVEKVGNSLYAPHGTLLPADPSVQVKQGFLEGSGTNSVSEMMQLIEASRSFETNMNMIKFHDETLGQLLQSAAR